ncbi:MAG: MBL fold metallo-hydrolase [Mizugakiibacter sp.]|uniref:MBL fold metallo-hydrolase n=1 Tax=Mizugakiibacter sp. TaxID=1972610 RepID=UPI0031CBFF8C|nr:MBL fold metallo-hydrolase [Xanthomonadaceae bacterium]
MLRLALSALLALIATAAPARAAPAPPAHAAPAAWAASDMALPVHRVGAHSYYVEGRLEEASRANEGFIANAGFVITDGGVVVFDALGSPALADRLIAAIRARTDRPIRRVVISHYHADHFYGIPAFRRIGAEIWADARARAYLNSPAAAERLAERERIIGRWLGPHFSLPLPDRWIDGDQDFVMGGVHFALRRLGPAHSPEDLAMQVEPDGVLYSGDVVYAGRVPFIGDADTRLWLRAIDRLLAIPSRVMVPGHGPASFAPRRDARMTREYLDFLREQMGRAVRNFVPFDDAYRQVDWKRFQAEPTFDVANRRNAYNVYLQMEQEMLGE